MWLNGVNRMPIMWSQCVDLNGAAVPHVLTNLPPILDFEASSLSDTSYPISAGLLLKGEIHYWVIKPEPDWIDWSLQSQAIHGLTRSFIETQGQPVQQVYTQMVALLQREPYVYSDNPEWEQMWFSRLGARSFGFLNVLDLLSPRARPLFPLFRTTMIEKHGLTAHRADHDVLGIGYAVAELHSAERD